MGLTIRIFNIISDDDYSVSYKSGSEPFPINDLLSYTLVGNYISSNTDVTIDGLEFDTQYWIKISNSITNNFVIKNIFINDSKAFPCYDTINFDANGICV